MKAKNIIFWGIVISLGVTSFFVIVASTTLALTSVYNKKVAIRCSIIRDNVIAKDCLITKDGSAIKDKSKISDDESDINTYTSNICGYKINYPKDWYVFKPIYDDLEVATGNEEIVVLLDFNHFDYPAKIYEHGFEEKYRIYCSGREDSGMDHITGSYYDSVRRTEDYWDLLGKTDRDGIIANQFIEKIEVDGETFIIYQQYGWDIALQAKVWKSKAIVYYRDKMISISSNLDIDYNSFKKLILSFEFID